MPALRWKIATHTSFQTFLALASYTARWRYDWHLSQLVLPIDIGVLPRASEKYFCSQYVNNRNRAGVEISVIPSSCWVSTLAASAFHTRNFSYKRVMEQSPQGSPRMSSSFPNLSSRSFLSLSQPRRFYTSSVFSIWHFPFIGQFLQS